MGDWCPINVNVRLICGGKTGPKSSSCHATKPVKDKDYTYKEFNYA